MRFSVMTSAQNLSCHCVQYKNVPNVISAILISYVKQNELYFIWDISIASDLYVVQNIMS